MSRGCVPRVGHGVRRESAGVERRRWPVTTWERWDPHLGACRLQLRAGTRQCELQRCAAEAREWEKRNVERVSNLPITDYNHMSIDKSIRTRNT